MRKGLTKRWVAVLTVACMLIVAIPYISNAAFKPGTSGSYVAAKYMLELDGQPAGTLWTFKGGNAVAEVIQEPAGPDYFTKKHIGTPKYEDMTIEVGTGMAKGFYDWIKESMTMNYQRHNGAILTIDASGKEISRLEFYEALITEVTFPASDASSKDAAKMVIKIAPEYTLSKKGSGTKAKGQTGTIQKKWLPANFKLSIDGLNTSRVNKIEALTIKQTVVTDDIGDARDYQKEPGKLEFPNLIITMSSKDSEGFSQWFEDFVIQGNNDEAKEKNGSLEYLTPNLQEVLFKLDFKNLGIYRLTPDTQPNQENISRIKAELYCEKMVFSHTASKI